MNIIKLLLTIVLCWCTAILDGQSVDALRADINRVLADKSATVGVAIQGSNSKDTLSVNGRLRLPMQSVFKYHLALVVLSDVDKGKLDLNDMIKIDKERVKAYEYLWSPIRKKYPDGVEMSIADLLKYTIEWSDNMGCDILFELVGGTKRVETFLHDIGIKDIAIKHTEVVMQSGWDFQYENWTTPIAANLSLQLFYENANQLLSQASYDFLLTSLTDTQTGKKCIKGLLPTDAVVAHKTGRSGRNEKGLMGALNNIGIVFLPNGEYFYLSVLVCDSMEDTDTNKQIIAEIAKLTWEYFCEE